MARVVLAIFLFIYSLHAELRRCDNLEPIAKEIFSSDQETLLLVDVAGTLFMQADAVWHKGHDEWLKEWFEKNAPEIKPEETLQLIYIMQSEKKNIKLVDEQWPSLIKQAASKVQVGALTRTILHPMFDGLRPKMLKELGFQFSPLIQEAPQSTLFVYTDGVIETDAPLKGPVLEEFLTYLKKKPSKIIFVDDSMKQVLSIEETCEALSIPSVSFHYTANEIAPPLDKERADLQLRTLVHEHRWIQ